MTYQVFQSGPRKGIPKTLTDRVVRFLTEGLNRVEVKNKSKYRMFIHTKDDTRSPYFVGKAGAVRAGRNASNSMSLTSRIHINMKLWERKQQKEV